MANTLKFKRGLLAGLPTAAEGEPLFTTDTKDLYIGTSTGNQRFQKYIASGATTQILRGDGSLYSFPLAISSPSNGQVLKFNGTNWVNDSDAGITGSGSAGQVAYFTGATTQSGDNNLFYSSANGRLGIGTTTTPRRLNLQQSTGGNAAMIGFYTQEPTLFAVMGAKVNTNDFQLAGIGNLIFYAGSTIGGAATEPTNERMRLWGASGNLAIGGTFGSDSGQRLQVTGEAIISSATGPQLIVSYPSGGSLRISASSTANSFSLLDNGGYGFSHNTSATSINARQTNLNIWTQAADTLTLGLGGQDINPTVARTRTFIQPVSSASTAFAPTSGTAIDYLFRTAGNSNFAPTSGTATYTQVQFAPVINQTGGANGITRGFYVAPTLTAAADWRSIEWSNNSGWGIYGAGTSDNFINGSLKIGSTTDVSAVAKFLVNFSSQTNWGITINNFYTALPNNGFFTRFYNAGNEIGGINAANGSSELLRLTGTNGLMFTTGAGVGTERMRLTTTNGNLHIGTFSSDTGERLQVTGTAKITGNTSIESNLTVDTNTLFVNASTNRVGIGIITPSSLFHAYGTTGVTIETSSGNIKAALDFTSAFYGGTIGGMYAYPGGGGIGNNVFGESANSSIETILFSNSSSKLKIGTVGTDVLSFYTNSQPRVNITSGGNVGIGVSPRLKSEIAATLSAPTALSSNTAAGNLLLSDGGNIGMVLGLYNTSFDSYIQARNNLGSNNTAYNLILNPLGGNVGAGVTSPTAYLDVRASTSGAASLRLRSGAAPTTLNDGDIWFDGTDLKMRIGGVTKTFTLV